MSRLNHVNYLLVKYVNPAIDHIWYELTRFLRERARNKVLIDPVSVFLDFNHSKPAWILHLSDHNRGQFLMLLVELKHLSQRKLTNDVRIHHDKTFGVLTFCFLKDFGIFNQLFEFTFILVLLNPFFQDILGFLDRTSGAKRLLLHWACDFDVVLFSVMIESLMKNILGEINRQNYLIDAP